MSGDGVDNRLYVRMHISQIKGTHRMASVPSGILSPHEASSGARTTSRPTAPAWDLILILNSSQSDTASSVEVCGPLQGYASTDHH